MKTLGIPPLIARNTLLFALAQALSGSAVQLVPTLGAPMVERLLGSASLAGIGFSVIALSRVLMAYPFGKLADTLGRKRGSSSASAWE
jgi:MFS family permease